MKVEDLQKTPLVRMFLQAGKELGFDIRDVNGAQQIGRPGKVTEVKSLRYDACLVVLGPRNG